jgi:beta-galactosidase
MKNSIIFACLLLSICTLLLINCSSDSNSQISTITISKEGRSEILFDGNWRFCLGDIEGAEKPQFDDEGWRKVDLPHDWSIEDIPGTSSPFSKDAISQVGGGFTKGGTGWYRKSFVINEEQKGKRILIQFDGIYMNPEIWINGESLGNHPYGYTSFWYDITDKIKLDKTNVISVKVRNEGANSRWYSGSGIYRHVWLKVVNPLNIAQWGTNITTTNSNNDSARITILTKANNQSTSALQVKLLTRIMNSKGEEMNYSVSEETIEKDDLSEFSQEISIKNPELWSTESPVLYTAVSELFQKKN